VIVTGVFDGWLFPSRSLPQQLLHRYALRAADVNLFVSQFELKEVTELAKVNNPTYSPLTIDTDLFKPGNAERDTETLLCLPGSGMDNGNSHRKCIVELIEAIALVVKQKPNVKCIIPGKQGTDYPKLLELAHSLGLKDVISFPGIVSLEDKLSLMQTCTVFLQPTRYEGFGLSLLEALATGAPSITSAEGNIPELIGDTALTVDGTKPEEIAKAIIQLLDSPEEREKLSKSARERSVTLFSRPRRLADLREICESLLKKYKRKS
jgi:glycosyltransferase involved in cell wall biosynthesis